MHDKDALVYDSGLAFIIDNNIIIKIDDNDSVIDEYIPGYIGGKATYNDYIVIDANYKAITPGFVDSHTHLVWSGDRSNELSMRQKGMSYADIAYNGGGINKTVKKTRLTPLNGLVKSANDRVGIAMQNGTTSLEAKSGYGLNTDTELNSLKAIDQINKNSPCRIYSTWLGAHDFPKDISRSEYIEQLINDQLPEIVNNNLAKYVDVFCEPGWYNAEETELIVNSAKEYDLTPRLHIDEFIDSDGLSLATELGAVSADHVAYSNDDSRQKASDNGTMQTFLPGTPYVLGKKFNLPIKKCIDEEWAFSIASDFNPNCPSLSLPFVGSILSHRLDIDPLASLVAATRNPATTLDQEQSKGILEIGSPADLNILWSEYVSGWCQTPGINPVEKTIINGIIVNSNKVI